MGPMGHPFRLWVAIWNWPLVSRWLGHHQRIFEPCAATPGHFLSEGGHQTLQQIDTANLFAVVGYAEVVFDAGLLLPLLVKLLGAAGKPK